MASCLHAPHVKSLGGQVSVQVPMISLPKGRKGGEAPMLIQAHMVQY